MSEEAVPDAAVGAGPGRAGTDDTSMPAASSPGQQADDASRAERPAAASAASTGEATPQPPDEPAAESGDTPFELFEFRLQVCATDSAGHQVAVHTKCERDDTFPSRNTVKVASKQKYTLIFQVANATVPFDSLLAVRVGEFDVPITKQLRTNNDFVCEGLWDTSDITPTGDGFRIQMPVRVAYLLSNERYCRETEFILQMKVYEAKDARKAQQGGTPLDCISCKFYRNSSRSVNYPTFLRPT